MEEEDEEGPEHKGLDKDQSLQTLTNPTSNAATASSGDTIEDHAQTTEKTQKQYNYPLLALNVHVQYSLYQIL